jgi:pimeloyl-ACP methyl ester carboxylesterase
MRQHESAGYRIIANNLELNTNVRSYYTYSFQTVEYSGTGELLDQYLNMDLPRLFIYGDRNEGLSYLPKLRSAGLTLEAISGSDHFVFYDNPRGLYQAVVKFLNTL